MTVSDQKLRQAYERHRAYFNDLQLSAALIYNFARASFTLLTGLIFYGALQYLALKTNNPAIALVSTIAKYLYSFIFAWKTLGSVRFVLATLYDRLLFKIYTKAVERSELPDNEWIHPLLVSYIWVNWVIALLLCNALTMQIDSWVLPVIRSLP